VTPKAPSSLHMLKRGSSLILLFARAKYKTENPAC
jgi:hypothetical protein